MSVFVLVGMSIAAMLLFFLVAFGLAFISVSVEGRENLVVFLDNGTRVMIMASAISGGFSVIAVVSGMLMMMGVGL